MSIRFTFFAATLPNAALRLGMIWNMDPMAMPKVFCLGMSILRPIMIVADSQIGQISMINFSSEYLHNHRKRIELIFVGSIGVDRNMCLFQLDYHKLCTLAFTHRLVCWIVRVDYV